MDPYNWNIMKIKVAKKSYPVRSGDSGGVKNKEWDCKFVTLPHFRSRSCKDGKDFYWSWKEFWFYICRQRHLKHRRAKSNSMSLEVLGVLLFQSNIGLHGFWIVYYRILPLSIDCLVQNLPNFLSFFSLNCTKLS